MIISRTPFRLSFLGGGTDYPSWYLKNGGSVLSTAINKYCYITLRYLPPFFEHRFRIAYSKVETCEKIDEIKHPAVREVLRFSKIDRGLEIHHDGDLPARSGMGSSSAFTVGLLHALYALQGKMVSRKQLAMESIYIEQNMMKEIVGSQDQVASAFGGINNIVFEREGEIHIKPLTLLPARSDELYSHLMLFYTGIMRNASEVAQTYIENIEEKRHILRRMHEMVGKGIAILQGNQPIYQFGELLHESWLEKRSLGTEISNTYVDNLYKHAREYGAIGGKISGAGGGGMMLLFVPPPNQKAVRDALKDLLYVPFKIEYNGSQIVLYDPQIEDYFEMEKDRRTRHVAAFRELNDCKKTNFL